jgi:hypothetical protein
MRIALLLHTLFICTLVLCHRCCRVFHLLFQKYYSLSFATCSRDPHVVEMQTILEEVTVKIKGTSRPGCLVVASLFVFLFIAQTGHVEIWHSGGS